MPLARGSTSATCFLPRAGPRLRPAAALRAVAEVRGRLSIAVSRKLDISAYFESPLTRVRGSASGLGCGVYWKSFSWTVFLLSAFAF